MKIVILDGYTENPGDLSWAGFEALGELVVHQRTALDDGGAEALARMAGAQAVITNKTPITAEMIKKSPALEYIGVLATGYNVVDLAAAKVRGIPVTNIPAYSTASVGQFAIALLLEICCQVGHHNAAVHDGRWEASPDFCFWDTPLIELDGKTLGLVGFGRIAQATGRIAKALGMEVVFHNRSPRACDFARQVTLDELFAASDVISLHCPLFPETQGIINRDSIAKMKDGVILINTSRGPLVAEQDLADALNSGKVYAAGLDVVSTEPIRGDNPLLKAKNCIITPHIAWAPRESRQRLMDTAVGNLEAFVAGCPVNVVNG